MSTLELLSIHKLKGSPSCTAINNYVDTTKWPDLLHNSKKNGNKSKNGKRKQTITLSIRIKCHCHLPHPVKLQ